jgi:nucleoside-diphosphate-sugar epimerase
MQIAVLGATSHIARDLILNFFRVGTDLDIVPYARNCRSFNNWFDVTPYRGLTTCRPMEAFAQDEGHEAIINCVGVGDPLKAVNMGNSILQVTQTFDDLALNYLSHHPLCKYIFMSSGAVYGELFDQPIDDSSEISISTDTIEPQTLYRLAKLRAEIKHRATIKNSIFDIRIFSYFSHQISLESRFFMSDLLRSLIQKRPFITNDVNLIRDYLGSRDLHHLVECLLTSTTDNCALDAYTIRPIDKFTILQSMRAEFGLNYEILNDVAVGINATGHKKNYYSLSRKAAQFGYKPNLDSITLLMEETKLLLSKQNDV